MAHLCGLCLALRDEHGHLSRLVTNYDGLLVSVLTEAQAPATSPHRRAAACALRGFKGADVADASQGVRLAAATSLVLAAGKLRDHIADADGPYRRRTVAAAAERVAARWSRAGDRTAAAVGFDTGHLTAAVEEQTRLERSCGLGLLEVTTPTESAVAAAFAHTALLAGKPHNQEALREIGRYFGRLAHILDAVEDLSDDRAAGAYNPLTATGTGLTEARRHCDDALLGLRLAVGELDLEHPRLVRALLVKELDRSVTRIFTMASPETRPDDPKHTKRRRRDPGGLLSMACAAVSCCTCGLYRAPWDEERENSCAQRFDCSGCDACGQCWQGCTACGEGCNCCGCDCNCCD
ncbi:hypothetical protein Ssi02_24930 [Sinosporangium siamense]|uniref:Regulatory protein n=2 Tax=Sinosporangium siamense TaxID=1367973 RepID=A0A919RF65_9ACTN|nr:hypothetical protein Ssi02_24930 [Sinosporangium siamense]